MERFGRYVLLERIASGGMAEVFRAAAVGSAGFSKMLAIKRMLPHLLTREDFVTMLVDEAKIAATLNHPNILQVLDLGEAGGQYFVAMEFVAGRTLMQVLAAALQKGVRLPQQFSLYVVAQALDGLAYAHQKTDALGAPMNIIHRDVSPQNIMVSFDGTVRLADFGIAKAAQRTTTDTAAGSIKGKPGYLAPEQITGDAIDQRVDIYAMGVVLHEMLSMRRMRRGSDDMKVLLEVFNGTYARFEETGVEVPEDVANAVYRALEPNPLHRWQTAGELARVLYDILRTAQATVGPQQVSALMGTLFPEDIAAEHEAQQRFANVMQQLSLANTMEISDIIRKVADASGMAAPGDATVVQELPEARSRRPLLGAVAAAVAVASVLGVFAFRGPAQGRLTISSEPPGAFIKVGGVARGTTPLTLEALPEGTLTVEAALEGMAPASQSAAVTAGGTTHVAIRLAPREAELPVTTTPPGAEIKVDGKVVGRTPMTLRLGGSSPVLISVELPGHAPKETLVTPGAAPAQLSYTLEKAPDVHKPAAGKKGKDRTAASETKAHTGTPATLSLQSKPWAKILVDGVDTGRFTPATNLEVKPGKHTIKLINDDSGLAAVFTVNLKPGQTQKIFKELK